MIIMDYRSVDILLKREFTESFEDSLSWSLS